MPDETVREHCKHKDCKYRGRYSDGEYCKYLLATGRPRGCDISSCDKYEAGTLKRRATLEGFRWEDDV